MKRIYFLAALCALASAAFAQNPNTRDTTIVKSQRKDTIRIGSIIIIKNRKGNKNDSVEVFNDNTNLKRNKKVNTNYFIFDVGFANWSDQSNYATTGSSVINRPGTPAFSAEDMKLRGGKSANVNIWLFMQKISLAKNNVNLKYGLGLEYMNYNFRSPVSLKEGGVNTGSPSLNVPAPFVFRDSISFSKNKLNLKYVTVPLMLNFATTKQKGKPSLSASVGVSASYLIRERNKQNSTERGKQKNQGDYDLQRFKFSYIGELGLGPIRLYGTYTPKSIFEKGLDLRPYTIGVRFSNW
jgi:Outer membrane protein beta-barrel domain